MKSLTLMLSAGLLLMLCIPPAFSAKKSKSPPKKTSQIIPRPAPHKEEAAATPEKEDIFLSPEALFRFGKETASGKVRSRMPQIDILNAIYRNYKEDPGLLSGLKRVIIQGEDFQRAFVQIEPLFNSDDRGGKSGVFQSKIAPPEIRYRNFKKIIMFCDKGRHRISIELNEGYTQELPYTFGAKIRLARTIEGTLRSDDRTNVTEVVFDSDQSVFFIAPGIAFFVPDIRTRIARIAVEGGEMLGYVIGRPESALNRYVSIRYNLSTCAKTSIKSEEMSPGEYSRKLSRVN